MKVLISPVSLSEAELVADAGVDILDIKNTKEGSLGAQFPWTVKEIVGRFRSSGIVCSTTLGDLSYKPGTAALAAYGAAQCGVTYIKAGLHTIASFQEGLEVMQGIVRAAHMVDGSISVVASGYADFRRFNGLPFRTVVDVAKRSGASVVMLDTYYKDGATLFDVMTVDELKEFCRYAHELGLLAALAGSINASHLANIHAIAPDIVGVRGAVCAGNERQNTINSDLLTTFLRNVRVATPSTELA